EVAKWRRSRGVLHVHQLVIRSKQVADLQRAARAERVPDIVAVQADISAAQNGDRQVVIPLFMVEAEPPRRQVEGGRVAEQTGDLGVHGAQIVRSDLVPLAVQQEE